MVGQDRRKHQRVPVQIDIAYDNDVVLTQANVHDLSLGGASILTPAPLPVGSQLSIWFRGEEPNIDVKARVVRVTEEDPDDETAHPGMAVQFVQIPANTEATLQQWIDWYLAQPARAPQPAQTLQEEAELPKTEEVSEQRYIQTQILPTIAPTEEASAEPTALIMMPSVDSDETIVAEAIETPQDLEATQHEAPQPEANPFATPSEANPFAVSEVNPFSAPTEESMQTTEINLAELEAKRAARHPDPVLETIRMHPEDLAALRDAAQDAHGDTTVTLPEIPAFNPDADNEATPSDSGERKSRRKKKR